MSSKDISDIEVSDEELAKQLEHFAQVAPEYQQIITEAEEIIKDIYDTDAKILRPKSFAERREYLVQYRADLATASEDDEDLEMIDDLVSTFISEMNDRGCTLNRRILATATLLACATVFTLTFFPTDFADASHCGIKEKRLPHMAK